MSPIIPIIDDLHNLNEEIIHQLMEIGFCYVQLPGCGQIKSYLKELEDFGLNFFRNKKLRKQYLMNEQFEGYADRENANNPQTVKQFIFRPEKPIGPFINCRKVLSEVNRIFQYEICLNLVKKIFEVCGYSKKFTEVSNETFASFAFLYYPEKAKISCQKGLNEHKDFEMITVLWITKPGLEVFYQQAWHPINPLSNYVIVNLGNALQMMLGGRCKAALHRVKLIEEERLSFGIFIGPGTNTPLVEYSKNQILFPRFADYLANQFNQHYEE